MSYFRSSTIELSETMHKSQMFGNEFFKVEKNFALPDIENKKARFMEQIRSITDTDELLEKIMLKLMILEDGIMPHPIESYKNRFLFKKVEAVYMYHEEAMSKRQLDEMHKPLFMRFAREGYKVNGVLIPDLKDNLPKLQNLERGMLSSWKNHIYDLLHDEESSCIAMVLYIFVNLSIIVSIVCSLLSSVEEYQKYYHRQFEVIEMIINIIFTIEFWSRVLIVRNRWSYVKRVMNIFDILAIFPWYIMLIYGAHSVPTNGSVMKSLRLSRIAKTRQLATPYTNMLLQSLINTITGTGNAIVLLLFICSIVTGSLVYECERNAGSGFDNIPIAMWWSFVTLSTVGYGDISPTTTPGYFMATLTILFGILLSSLIIMVVGQYYIDLLCEYTTEISDIQKLLFTHYGAAQYRAMVLNTTPKQLYNTIMPELTRIFEELEDNSTEMVSDSEDDKTDSDSDALRILLKDLNLDVGNIDAALLSVILSQIGIYYSIAYVNYGNDESRNFNANY